MPRVDTALARRIADAALAQPGPVTAVRAFAVDAAPLDLRRERASWQVAYADGHLDAHENHAINKVAGLLHVTHGEYIAAKLRAKEDARLP